MATPGIDINFPEVMSLRLASLYADISEQRLRSLVREGKIKATQSEQGQWMVSKGEIERYNAEKGHGGGGGGGAAKGAGKAYIIKVPADKHAEVRAALTAFGIELLPRYNYEHQKAYQEKRRAAKRAEKLVANGVEAEDEEL